MQIRLNVDPDKEYSMIVEHLKEEVRLSYGAELMSFDKTSVRSVKRPYSQAK
jgi:hypothetical protein